MNTKKWTTKDGRKIRICDMETLHLTNTVRMLRRNHEVLGLSEAMSLGAYMENAPDGAYDAASMALDELCEMDAGERYPILDDMLAELTARGVSL